MINEVVAILSGKGPVRTPPCYQYDRGRVLVFSGNLPGTFEVDFSNSPVRSSITQIGQANRVGIPDQYFESGEPVYVYLVNVGEDYAVTENPVCIIPVIGRSARTNEQPAPEPQSVIDQTIAALNAAVEDAETAVVHYPQIVDGTWRVWNVTAGEWVDTGISATGDDGIGISSIAKTGTAGLVDTYTITFTNGQTSTFTVTNGVNGDPGRDGVSPAITVSEITGGHRITITDAGHPQGQTVDVMDGTDGNDGRGIVSVTKISTSGNVDTYQITYTSGEPTTFTVTNGINGQDGVSPAVSISAITGGHEVTITDKDHPSGQSFNVLDGQQGDPGPGLPEGGTQGQIPVKKSATDYDTEWQDMPSIPAGATAAEVKAGTASGAFIPPSLEDAAAFFGIAKAAGDTSQSASSNAVGVYTSDALIKIQKMLGIYEAPWEVIRSDTFTNATAASYEITADNNGNPFELTDILFVLLTPQQETEATLGSSGRVYVYYNASAYETAYFSSYTQATNASPRCSSVKIEQKNGLREVMYLTNNTTGGDPYTKIHSNSVPQSDTNGWIIGQKRVYTKIVIAEIKGTAKYALYGKRKWTV